MFRLIRNAAQPHISVQGVLENKSHFQNMQDNPEVKQIPGILVLKIESAMIFFNADFVKTGIMKLISEQEKKVNCVIINAESINFLDVTAANTLENLINELSVQGIKLFFARANSRFMSMISEMDILNNKPEEINFISVHNAVKYYKNLENGTVQ